MIIFRVVGESPGLPEETIRPGDIEVRAGGGAGRFGKCEVEAAAGAIVLFCQERYAWTPFNLRELWDFYEIRGLDYPDRMLYGLAGVWWDDAAIVGGWKDAPPYLVVGQDGRYRVTDLFIRRCACLPEVAPVL